jgi:hypothetical protein
VNEEKIMTFMAALFVLSILILAFIINGFLDKRADKKDKGPSKPRFGA